MAKKAETPGSDDSKEEKEVEKKEQKLEEKVEKKIENSPDPAKAVNIIGDIKKPDPADEDDVKSYFKKIDQKLDQLLNPKKPEPKKEIPEPETMPKREEKKVAWYDKELF